VLAGQSQCEVGLSATPYQRVTNQFDVTETGQPNINYLWFDGIDDCLQSATAIDFSNSDEMTVSVGARKLTDTPAMIFVRLNEIWPANNGTFNIRKNSLSVGVAAGSRGTIAVGATLNAPAGDTLMLLTTESKISSPFVRIRNLGGAFIESTASQGTGNYRNDIVYVGGTPGGTENLQGHLHSGFIINRILNPLVLADYERYWVAKRAGIDL
jgi:hypothetical protein